MKIKSISTQIEREFAAIVANEFDLSLSEECNVPILMNDSAYLAYKNKFVCFNVQDFRKFYPFNPLRDSKLVSNLLSMSLSSDPDVYVLDYSIEYDKKRPNYKRVWLTTQTANGPIQKRCTRYYKVESIAYLEALIIFKGEDAILEMMHLENYDVEE